MNSCRTMKYLTSSLNWYSFLADANEHLTDFRVQRNTDAYNVADLADWGQVNKPNGLIIAENNFNEFVTRIKRDANFKPSLSKFDELNEMIEITLKSPPKYECAGDVMTIKGNYVKSSDIRPIECSMDLNFKVSKIQVFVTDTFYVDGNLDLSNYKEVELNIFAPTWNILELSTFYLNGIDGEEHPKLEVNGTAGRVGNPGKNSGNFFGLANEVINNDLLTVEQIGGKGGDGQNGTGNSNVIVYFNKTEYKCIFVPLFISPERMKKNLINFIRNESGVHEVDSLDPEQFDGVNRLNPFMDGYKYNFRLHPSNCCGSTGIGGSGKQLFYFIWKKISLKKRNFSRHKRKQNFFIE